MRGNHLDPLLKSNEHHLQPVAKAVVGLAVNVTASTLSNLRDQRKEGCGEIKIKINLVLQNPATRKRSPLMGDATL